MLSIAPDIPLSEKQKLLEVKFSDILLKIVQFEENLELQKQELVKEEAIEINDIRNSVFAEVKKDYFMTRDFKNAFTHLQLQYDQCTLFNSQMLFIRFSSVKDIRDVDEKEKQKFEDFIMTEGEFGNLFVPQKDEMMKMALERSPHLPVKIEKGKLNEEQKHAIASIQMNIGAYFSWLLEELLEITNIIQEFVQF